MEGLRGHSWRGRGRSVLGVGGWRLEGEEGITYQSVSGLWQQVRGGEGEWGGGHHER